MFDNPFTPIFGGKPEFFFGRQALLARFGRSLAVRGGEDRALFITGTRGMGKTALVERLSGQARVAGWETIDVSAENALAGLFRHLARFDTKTTTVAPQVSVTVFGTGGSVGGSGTQNTSHYTLDDLDTLLLERAAAAKAGLFVSIDEVQKVPLDDISRICGAVQMASRKGCDIALVVAGLPYAHADIIHHDGCTYMWRCVHEELGLLSRAEVEGAFVEAFAAIEGLGIAPEALQRLVEASSGHPYMMQLLGYHAVEVAGQNAGGDSYRLTAGDAEAVVPVALAAYERRSLQPLLDEMGEGETGYLRAMASLMEDARLAATGDVARAMGREHRQVAPYRQKLLDAGVIVAPARGTVRFNIPYLREFVRKVQPRDRNERLLDEWDV